MKKRKTGREAAVTFRIAKIHVAEFSLDEDHLNYSEDDLRATINHKITVVEKRNEAKVRIHVTFQDPQKNLQVCSMTCISTFEIDNLSSYKRENEFDLPELFLVTIGSIGYTHTRALLSQSSNGRFMLPMINPDEIFGKSIREAMDRKSKRVG